eukprot:GILI01014735.1.p1 GENE.GILI01014735.1~~GILI01014735.1.p1  ORF type:complete len:163 (+),score=38.32 GILI01014735.1:130-618(+)
MKFLPASSSSASASSAPLRFFGVRKTFKKETGRAEKHFKLQTTDSSLSVFQTVFQSLSQYPSWEYPSSQFAISTFPSYSHTISSSLQSWDHFSSSSSPFFSPFSSSAHFSAPSFWSFPPSAASSLPITVSPFPPVSGFRRIVSGLLNLELTDPEHDEMVIAD